MKTRSAKSRLSVSHAGELHGVSPVRFDAVPSLFGNEGGRDDPADMAFFRQIAIEPVATGTGFVDEDQLCGLRLHFAYELIDVTLTRPNGAQGGHLSASALSC